MDFDSAAWLSSVAHPAQVGLPQDFRDGIRKAKVWHSYQTSKDDAYLTEATQLSAMQGQPVFHFVQQKFEPHKLVTGELQTLESLEELSARLDNQEAAAQELHKAAAAAADAGDEAGCELGEPVGPVQTSSALLDGIQIDQPATKKQRKNPNSSKQNAPASSSAATKPSARIPSKSEQQQPSAADDKSDGHSKYSRRKSAEMELIEGLDQEMRQVAEAHLKHAGKNASCKSLMGSGQVFHAGQGPWQIPRPGSRAKLSCRQVSRPRPHSGLLFKDDPAGYLLRQPRSARRS